MTSESLLLLILDGYHVLKLPIHLWNLSLLLYHIIISGPLNRVIFRGIYLSVLSYLISSGSALSTIFVIDLNVIAVFLLFEILLEVLLTNFAIAPLGRWLIACDVSFTASVGAVGANTTAVWSAGARGAFKTTFAGGLVDGAASSGTWIAQSCNICFRHFWVLTRVLVLTLTRIAWRWASFWHNFELHFSLNDIWRLQLLIFLLPSMI